MTTAATAEPLVESSQIISALASYLIGPKEHDLDQILSYYLRHESADPKNHNKVVVTYPNKFFLMLGDKLTEKQIQTVR
jgi:hypothetical protein